MAAALTPPGAVITVHETPYEIAAFLRPRGVGELPGIGPRTAQTLTRYGISTVGDIADTPPATLQRILGASAARQAQALAHGTDHRPVVPAAPAKCLSAGHRFDRDELDADRHQRRSSRTSHPLPHAARGHRPHPHPHPTARDLLRALRLQRARVRVLSPGRTPPP
ncbi:helix-hairpin-helix domain-containing protein [Streptomyces sp. NPDC007325]|uniref:helix-hairpin-helix domain-containing protein n=1 Tax=Streptomyces sp. NPDC007325 TaxID=3154588 RepID=UPI0033E53491